MVMAKIIKMENKVLAVPRHGTWEELYNRVRKANGDPVWIDLKVTPELFGNLRNYDLIWEAKQLKYLRIQARYRESGNIIIDECVQQNYGDEDGFGVEPDNYMTGEIGPDGYFVKPFEVS